jgi:uncharacterized protein with ATP-grasp and redox domains
MKTSLDCLPCFLRQALYAARLCSPDPVVQENIMVGILPLLGGLNFQISPPENAVVLYDFIAETGACLDPFAALKKESTSVARDFLPQLKKIINSAPDPFEAAVKLTLAGNIIDYGSQQSFNVQRAITDCLADQPRGNTIAQFQRDVERAETILYLGDNCGELLFDSLFIKQLTAMGKKITFAVKERPIINDALYEDAVEATIDTYCKIISNGTGVPGTPLRQCSDSFRSAFHNVDVIISKGQGNFETLSEVTGPIYYLLTVKCEVVARHLSLALEHPIRKEAQPQPGDMIVLKNRNWERATSA